MKPMQGGRASPVDLNKITDFLSTISDMSEQVKIRLDDTDYTSMNSFRPYVNPQKNIQTLLDFYERLSAARDSFNEFKSVMGENGIETTEVQNEAQGSPRALEPDRDEGQGKIQKTIGELERLSIRPMMKKVQAAVSGLDHIEGLPQVNRVKIAKRFKEEVETYMRGIRRVIRKAFFLSLNDLPVVPKHAHKYAKYLMGKDEKSKKTFLGQFSLKVQRRMGFVIIKNNLATLVQQTRNLSGHFNLISDVIREILGQDASNKIQAGLIETMALELKSLILDILGSIDKDNQPEKIPQLIELLHNLSKPGKPVVIAVEELSDVRTAVSNLICNCLSEFIYGVLDVVSYPSKEYRTEKAVKMGVTILDSFDQYKEEKKTWLRKWGPQFGVHKKDDHTKLNTNIGSKCLKKVDKLGEKLKDVPKYVYKLNNYHALHHHVHEYRGRSISVEIDRLVRTLTGLWRIEMEVHTKAGTGKVMIRELLKHRRYYLPSEIRGRIHAGLVEIVEVAIGAGKFKENPVELNEAIAKSYTGDKS